MSPRGRRVCPKCGVVFRGDAEFCVRDGARLEHAVGRDPLLGRVLEGRYRLVRRLREGGSGTVYKAQDERIGQTYAVKIPFGDVLAGDRALLRLRREAEAAGRLNHPNVASVLDVQLDNPDAPPFLVMELVQGRDLKEWVRAEGPRSEAEVRALLEGILAGLAHAHAHDVLHRDLKPDNVIVEDVTGRPRIVDFGISRSLDPNAQAGLTTQGVVVGTIGFIPPEGLRGKTLDARADIYALGVTACFLLLGRLPFEAIESEVLSSTLDGIDLEPLRRVGVSDDLISTLSRWLAIDPARRPSTVTEMLAELTASPSTRVTLEDRPPRVPGFVVALLAGGVVAALVVWLGSSSQRSYSRLPPPPPPPMRAAPDTPLPASSTVTPAPSVSPPVVSPDPPRRKAQRPRVRTVPRRNRSRKKARPPTVAELTERYGRVGRKLESLSAGDRGEALRRRYFAVPFAAALRDPGRLPAAVAALRSLERDVDKVRSANGVRSTEARP